MKEFKDLFPYILGGLIILSVILVLYLLFTVKLPNENRDLIYLILGTILGAFTTVVQYHYGSSKGSADKDKIIQNKE